MPVLGLVIAHLLFATPHKIALLPLLSRFQFRLIDLQSALLF
ncbi:hypothetical protein Aazo_0142 ['Nostoc azollae' 0708]|uniref:Uncharacterized protein n=1 Tax=Nostoc azollae (strain 0708) TaxID=551115 RepID=D7DVF2_NOSA0|nr:hypothetical protein Aazo_0142 ['Nostoc azollae' 0708]